MIKEDIKKRDIDIQILLDAMLKVKRHLFVPEGDPRIPYEDRYLPVGEG